MTFLFTLTNVFLLLLLWKALRSSRRTFYFNPYLSGTDRLLDRLVENASPILPGLPAQGVAVVLFLFLLLFRSLLFSDLTTLPLADFGAGLFFLPPEGTPKLARALLAGTARFLQFLFSFWGSYLLVKLLAGPKASSRVGMAFEDLASPFSRLRPWQMGIALLAVNALLAATFLTLSAPLSHGFAGTQQLPALLISPLSSRFPLLALWLGAFGVLRSLLFLQELLMALIFTSLFSLLFGKQQIALFCQEAIDLTMGRFTNHPLRAGAFDFTPILFYIGLSFAYQFIARALLFLHP